MENTENNSVSDGAEEAIHSGIVAFIGRPNSGKSTLLNKLVGEKIAAVSDKPQTTRTQIKGILNLPKGQIVFVDTPGVHKPGYKLNRRMMQAVAEALQSVDIVILMRDVSIKMGQGERYVLDLIKESARPTFLLLNKVDLVKDKTSLLPIIDFYRQEYEFQEVIPLSARTGKNTNILVDKLLEHLPIGPRLFEEDTLTDRSMRSIAAEMVREKVLRFTGEELPFVTAVVTEYWQENAKEANINCAIYVERDSQRAIILGRAGQKIKQIGSAARKDIEHLLGKRIFLSLFVKVKENWRNDERVLDELGLEGVSHESS
ncbi:MAG: GTPase Era [Blastocatellia bacterium]|nr:GTPase Era [Blastocatellia bacterium]MBN8723854.1 GTPase Era [Acidobacteriota bacterium]